MNHSPTTSPHSTTISPVSPAVSPMTDFNATCDYCGEFVPVQWVFDRHHNEDRVACADCRVIRDLERPKVTKSKVEKLPTPRRGGWVEQ